MSLKSFRKGLVTRNEVRGAEVESLTSPGQHDIQDDTHPRCDTTSPSIKNRTMLFSDCIIHNTNVLQGLQRNAVAFIPASGYSLTVLTKQARSFRTIENIYENFLSTLKMYKFPDCFLKRYKNIVYFQ